MIKVFFIAFCLGILLAGYTYIPFLVFWGWAFVFLILGIVFLNRKICVLFLAACIFFLGSTLLRNTQVLPSQHISKFTPYRKSILVNIEGVVDSDPAYKDAHVSFVLKAQKIKLGENVYYCCGKVLVKCFNKEKFFYGDKLVLSGKLYRTPYFQFSERLNYRNHLKHEGIYSVLSVSKNSPVKLLDIKQGYFIKYFAYKIRHRMQNALEANLAPLFAKIFNAIILGKREGLPQELMKIFIQTGTIHIIAISGLHLGIIAFLTILFFKVIRLPRKLSFAVTIFVLIFYSVITGSNVPVIRSAIMASILLLAYLLEREVNIYDSLAVAGFVILFINPWQIFSISFQLSFLSIFSIAYFPPRIKGFFPQGTYSLKAIPPIINILAVSSGAWIGLMPLIAYYFKIITPVAILANIIVVPYLTVVIISGFLVVFASIFLPSVLPIVSAGSEFVIFFLLKAVYFFNRLPGGYVNSPKIHFYAVAIGYLLIFYCFSRSRRSNLANR